MGKEHKARSPLVSTSGPAPTLPASVENSYRKKCKEIKKRIGEIESSNDVLTTRIQRARRAIQRMRLERAFLLQHLESRTNEHVDDSEGSPSPPPTPGQKPLRVKRPRKDPPPMDSPMRQPSPSPLRDGHDTYSFVPQTFGSAMPTGESPGPYISQYSVGSMKSAPRPGPKGGSRNRGGPKRPPNAYMIFCEKERDSVRERESGKEGFDMHKALAQAWRDLKPEGQKPYFIEYEQNRERYLAKVQETKGGEPGAGGMAAAGMASGGTPVGGTSSMGAMGSGVGGVGRAVSAASTSNYDAAASPAPGSTMDEGEDPAAGEGFTAVNR